MVWVLGGCGGGDSAPAPSCQEAMEHFYGSGCAFFDSTNTPYPLAQAINDCHTSLENLAPGCQEPFDTFMACLDGVATSATCGDCSREQDALLSCH